MGSNVFSRSKLVKYLAWTFGLAYAVQAGVAVLYRSGNQAAGQVLTAAMMFVPMLGLLLSGGSLGALGWNPRIRKNVRPVLVAWFVPALLTVAGALLYFLCFPGHFDMSGSYLKAAAGDAVLEQMEAQGISYPVYLLISAAGSLTWAPLLNTALALGEEAGWRGFMYPQLKSLFGQTKGRLLGGVIWGAWHWPLIWLIGYEYGTEYAGFPVLGMLVFCVFTVPVGILCDWLYERSGSIWLPSLCHGAVNAVAGLPLVICSADAGYARLLGPVPNGIIAGLPCLVLAAVLLFHGKTAEPRPDAEG